MIRFKQDLAQLAAAVRQRLGAVQQFHAGGKSLALATAAEGPPLEGEGCRLLDEEVLTQGQAAQRDTHQTSCDAGYRHEPDKPISTHDVYETLVLDLDAPPKNTPSGADYDALSSHNPHITQSRFSFEVTP